MVLTGSRTVLGRINQLTSSTVEVQTNLQKDLQRFILIIITLTLTVIIIVVITWAAWLRVDHPDFMNTVALLTNAMSFVVGAPFSSPRPFFSC